MLVQTKEKFSLSASFTTSIIPPHLTANNQKLLRMFPMFHGPDASRIKNYK